MAGWPVGAAVLGVAAQAWEMNATGSTGMPGALAKLVWQAAKGRRGGLMNPRPRKTLGWKTHAEAMAEELAAFSSTVALET